MKFPDNPYVPLNLYQNFHEAAKTYPDTAIYFDEILPAFPELQLETTYLTADQLVVRRTAILQQLGIRPGDKVILYKSAKFDTYLLAVALTYIGAVPVMIAPHLPVATMEVLCDRLTQPWLVFDEVTAEKAQVLASESKARLISVTRLLDEPKNSAKFYELNSTEICYMTHTSGTTGIPKLIAHSRESMGWRTKWQRNVVDLIQPRKLIAFHISPVHSRFNIGISSIMSKGFPFLTIADPSIDNITKQLTQHHPYVMETHPNNFVQWRSLAEKNPELFAPIRYYHSTFDAINKQTMWTFLKTAIAPNPVFMQVYGQSECGPMILKFHTLENISTWNARNMGIGMPDLTEVRIVDEQRQLVPSGISGHIQMLSKGRALTYYKEDARFLEQVDGLFWDSGDYGYLTEAGELILQDRQVDLIDQIDSNLAIEDYLLDKLEFLSEVVIVRGLDDKPQPIISLRPDYAMDMSSWWQAVNELPLLLEPIILPFEKLPHTGTMKVQRLQLEKQIKSGLLNNETISHLN